ncbi:hypothetical protein [Streptomyces crystallinus]|uniref:C1q domain-containing protein n=1 Tax=Streptomyces crystallinus TaxID=68191 RepID=A0ABN1F0T0_9ACTN
MNARVRDNIRGLSNPPRLAISGLSKISGIPDDGTYKPLKWDSADQYGGWTTNDNESFTVPTSGVYLASASVTALVPADISKGPAFRLVCVNQQVQGGEREWLRSYNLALVPSTYLTCSLRGPIFAVQGDRLTLRANTPARTGAWEISSGSRPSTQLNAASFTLVAPGATTL